MKKAILLLIVMAQLQPVYGMFMCHGIVGFAEAGDKAIHEIVEEVAAAERLSTAQKKQLGIDLKWRKANQAGRGLNPHDFVAPAACRISVSSVFDILRRYIKNENNPLIQRQLREYIATSYESGVFLLLRTFKVDVNAQDESGISFVQHAMKAEHKARAWDHEGKLSRAGRIVQLLTERSAVDAQEIARGQALVELEDEGKREGEEGGEQEVKQD